MAVHTQAVAAVAQRQVAAAVDEVGVRGERRLAALVRVRGSDQYVGQAVAIYVAGLEVVGPARVAPAIVAALEDQAGDLRADVARADLDRAAEGLQVAAEDDVDLAGVRHDRAVEARRHQQVVPAVAIHVTPRPDRQPELRACLVAVEHDVGHLGARVERRPAAAVVEVDLARVLHAVDVGEVLGDQQVLDAVAVEVPGRVGLTAVVGELVGDPVGGVLVVEAGVASCRVHRVPAGHSRPRRRAERVRAARVLRRQHRAREHGRRLAGDDVAAQTPAAQHLPARAVRAGGDANVRGGRVGAVRARVGRRPGGGGARLRSWTPQDAHPSTRAAAAPRDGGAPTAPLQYAGDHVPARRRMGPGDPQAHRRRRAATREPPDASPTGDAVAPVATAVTREQDDYRCRPRGRAAPGADTHPDADARARDRSERRERQRRHDRSRGPGRRPGAAAAHRGQGRWDG